MRCAALAGITTLSVTDHDTTAALEEAAQHCAALGLGFVPGIEITAVDAEADVHVLAYFFDPCSPRLLHFLTHQRQDRVRRAREIAARLNTLGMPVNIEAAIGDAGTSFAVGRPQLAHALVRGGYVQSADEAFAHWLGRGRPAYVPRVGASPPEVVELIEDAGGIASLAHPGLLRRDALIGPMVEAGLGALEVYHGDHDATTRDHYLRMATHLKLGVTGGSDYHGESRHHRAQLGSVGLSSEQFDSFTRLRRTGGSGRP